VVMRTDDAGRGVERMFYSAYGQPECFPFGDVDGDYDVDNDDATALATIVNWHTATASSDINILADLNLDGVITQADLNLLNTNNYMNHSGGANVLSVDSEANDVGYAGYVWNDEMVSWHVRNRELSPRLGRWLQRDPKYVSSAPVRIRVTTNELQTSGFQPPSIISMRVDSLQSGVNIYQLVSSRPIDFLDPMGLERVCGPYVWLYTGDWCTDSTVYDAALDAAADSIVRNFKCWLSCVISANKCGATYVLGVVTSSAIFFRDTGHRLKTADEFARGLGPHRFRSPFTTTQSRKAYELYLKEGNSSAQKALREAARKYKMDFNLKKSIGKSVFKGIVAVESVISISCSVKCALQN